MNTITTKDGVEIFYKDWGKGQPIVFSHGWPLSADDWDNQMLFFLKNGYRVIAHDRRGHGRSSQVSDGHDMDHYAADAAAVVEHLDLRNAIHVGHSTGGGEATRYVARHGRGRVAKTLLQTLGKAMVTLTPMPVNGEPGAIARPLAVMLLTFGGAAYLGERVHARHWLDWAVGVAVTFALQLAVAFAAGLPPEARRGVLGRWRAMVATTRG